MPVSLMYEMIPGMKNQFEVIKKLMYSVGGFDEDKKELSTMSNRKKFVVPISSALIISDFTLIYHKKSYIISTKRMEN